MDWKIEVVSDIDCAKDYRISDEIRLVQLTPPGSARSIYLAAEGVWRWAK
jgi:hypothetical protein